MRSIRSIRSIRSMQWVDGMRSSGRLLATMTLALALAASTGCLAVGAAGATGLGVAYAQGNSHGTVNADKEQVLAAVREVLKEEREMFIVDEEMDRHRPRISARTPADRSVRVMVEERTPRQTKMWVRYGRFGDRNQSAELFLRIADVAEES